MCQQLPLQYGLSIMLCGAGYKHGVDYTQIRRVLHVYIYIYVYVYIYIYVYIYVFVMYNALCARCYRPCTRQFVIGIAWCSLWLELVYLVYDA